MPKQPPILDFSKIDTDNVIADIEEIRRYNRQRYEMEQITAICYEDRENHVVAGYKDLTEGEFWTRGHFPGMPLMPGVIMCEAAAQLASFYCTKYQMIDGLVGFGGLEEVRFRGVVRPGDRFLIAARLLRVRRSIMTCQFQCVVNQIIVCEGIVKGVALPLDELDAAAS